VQKRHSRPKQGQGKKEKREGKPGTDPQWGPKKQVRLTEPEERVCRKKSRPKGKEKHKKERSN